MDSPVSKLFEKNPSALTAEQVASWYASARTVAEFAAIAGSGKASQEALSRLMGSSSASVRAAAAPNIILTDEERRDWLLREKSPSVFSALMRAGLPPAVLEDLVKMADNDLLCRLCDQVNTRDLVAAPNAAATLLNRLAASRVPILQMRKFVPNLLALPTSAYPFLDLPALAKKIVEFLMLTYYFDDTLRLEDLSYPPLWHEAVSAASPDGLAALRRFFAPLSAGKSSLMLEPSDALKVLPLTPAVRALLPAHEAFPNLTGKGSLNPSALFASLPSEIEASRDKLVYDFAQHGWDTGHELRGGELSQTAWAALAQNPNLGPQWLADHGLALASDTRTEIYAAPEICFALRLDADLTIALLEKVASFDLARSESAAAIRRRHSPLLPAFLDTLQSMLASDSPPRPEDERLWSAVLGFSFKYPASSRDLQIYSGLSFKDLAAHRMTAAHPGTFPVAALRLAGWPACVPGEFLAAGVASLIEDLGPRSKAPVDGLLATWPGSVSEFLASAPSILGKTQTTGIASSTAQGRRAPKLQPSKSAAAPPPSGIGTGP